MSLNATFREYLAHFYRVSQIVSLTLEVDEVLRRVLDEVSAATGADQASWQLALRQRQTPSRVSGQVNNLPYTSGVTGAAIL